MNLPEKIKALIDREILIPAGTKIIAGVSGGADSVALLHILHRLNIPLRVAHLNHNIRGADADGDERFVKNLCAKLGVECITQKTDVPALAAEKKISIEMAAREARHDFFGQFSPSPVALAHHADDQLETFFLRAARGAGAGGLGGIRMIQQIKNMTLIRPLLGIRRAEIIEWLKSENLEWREDCTNSDETIPRNFVRHKLIPEFEKLNPAAGKNLLRAMELLRNEEDQTPRAVRRRAVRDWLIENDVAPDFETVEKVIEFSDETAGTKFLDIAGVRLINEYGSLKVDATSSSRFNFSIHIKESTGILRGPWCASVSQEKIAGREIIIRTARAGDRMNPYRMDGSKKLQDIFTDLKIPKLRRATWTVVECAGEIIWLPGYRIARGWELSSDSEPALHFFAKLEDVCVTK